MRATRRRRLPLIPLIWLPALAALYWYVTSRDWAHMARQYRMGHTPTWPRTKHDYHPPGVLRAASSTADPMLDLVGIALLVAAALALVVAARRLLERRRRARATVRWELRLGRDDLANPYRVQEAFEGIAGAISGRWYERWWRGCDHFAVETHRMPDESIRFTVAAPRYLRGAVKGPLEDLYPDVELVDSEIRPTWANAVVRV